MLVGLDNQKEVCRIGDNMKVHLTRFELCQLVGRAFNTPVEYVVIKRERYTPKANKTILPAGSEPRPLPYNLALDIENKIVKEFGIARDILSSFKVGEPLAVKTQIIKYLREITDKKVSLFDAKWAIEHWKVWIKFVSDYQRYPIIDQNGQMR